jgi:hypothetical protein
MLAVERRANVAVVRRSPAASAGGARRHEDGAAVSRWRSLAVTLLALILAVPASAATDSDGDGLSNTFENQTGVTSAHDADTDGDGVIDAAEDNDHDRLSNRAEQKFGSHPGIRDSDGDGTPDGKEDADRDGRSNAIEQDHRAIPFGLRPSLAAAPTDTSPYKPGCQTPYRSALVTLCSYGPVDSPITVVLMGDSHAMQLATPIKDVAVKNGWRLTTLIKKACPPVLGIHNVGQNVIDGGVTCRRWRRAALTWLNADPPDHILMAHSDAYGITTYAGKRIRGDARAAVWREGLKRTLRQLPASSEVLLFGDTPYNRVNPVQCLKQQPKNISKCVTSRQPLHKRKIELALEQAAKAKGARFRRFHDKACSYDPCPVIQGDILMYRDRGHMTATFMAQLTPMFDRMLTSIIGPAPARRRK